MRQRMLWRRVVTTDPVLDLHRPAGLSRERDGERLHLRVRLGPEAAAEVRHLDADVGNRHAEEVGDLGADEERVLTARPQRDLVAVDLCDHRVRLHRVLVDGRERVLALDDEIGMREHRLDLALVEAIPVADVPVARRELPEPVEQSGLGVDVGDERRSRRDRLLHVADDGQLLVLDDDRVERRCRLGGGLRGDRSDLLAVEAHLVDRDDRTILDRVPVVRIDVTEIDTGEYADDAGHPRGLGRVDRDDAAMRDRAPQDTAVQHSRHEHVADELRLAAQLLARVTARARHADLRACYAPFDGRRHSMPASSATASTIPR
jgi:hypothetical protein